MKKEKRKYYLVSLYKDNKFYKKVIFTEWWDVLDFLEKHTSLGYQYNIDIVS